VFFLHLRRISLLEGVQERAIVLQSFKATLKLSASNHAAAQNVRIISTANYFPLLSNEEFEDNKQTFDKSRLNICTIANGEHINRRIQVPYT